jgi:hypothetical protein
MNDTLTTLTEFGIESILMTVRFFIIMLQLSIGLALTTFILWVAAMTVTVPVMALKSILTSNKD